MGNTLITYFNKRLMDQSFSSSNYATKGPVITISREVGCDATKLAQRLAYELNKQGHSWKVLSKEVLYESARELNLDPEKIQRSLSKTDRYTFEEILKAFSDKRFKSDAKIAKTVRDVIYSLACEGHKIIVGRGSHIITQDIKDALHIRLIAPLELRILSIMQKKQLSRSEALKFIDQTERERIAFRKMMEGNSRGEPLFDLIINKATFSENQIIKFIQEAIEYKGILKAHVPQMQFY